MREGGSGEHQVAWLTWTAARPAQKRMVLAKARAHMGQVKPLDRFSIICGMAGSRQRTGSRARAGRGQARAGGVWGSSCGAGQ